MRLFSEADCRRLVESDKICSLVMRKHLYFRAFVTQLGVRMTRRFLLLFAFASLLGARGSLRADTTNTALTKSAVLENDVVYLRVGNVGTNLAEEIQSARNEFAISNKTAGTVLDLRFAGGDDPAAAAATAKLFAGNKSPLAILVNDQTSGAATTLAANLHEERAGLIFGETTAEVKPDIAVAAGTNDEKNYLENPYAPTATNEVTVSSDTNDLMPFVDHTSEAQLVRERRKDGDDDESSAPTRRAGPPQPVIRDPVLARAVDLIKGLAVVNARHN